MITNKASQCMISPEIFSWKYQEVVLVFELTIMAIHYCQKVRDDLAENSIDKLSLGGR